MFWDIITATVQVSTGGRKSRVLMSMHIAGELRDQLQVFDEYLQTLGNERQAPVNQDGQLRSAVISRDDRKYYLDLKENERGRFLRVREKNDGAVALIKMRMCLDLDGRSERSSSTDCITGPRPARTARYFGSTHRRIRQ